MVTCKNLYDRINNLEVVPVITDYLKANTGELADAQRDQMREGLTSKNETIHPAYPDGYFVFKRDFTSTYQVDFPNVPDLYLTGAFHKEIFAEVNSDINFDSNNGKATDLKGKYPDIFGLNIDSISKLNEGSFGDNFVTFYRNKINL